MAEALAHCNDVDAGAEEPRCARVPQVVRDHRHVRLACQPLEDVRCALSRPEATAEAEPRRSAEDQQANIGDIFGDLSLAKLVQCADGARVEIQRPRLVVLRRVEAKHSVVLRQPLRAHGAPKADRLAG